MTTRTPGEELTKEPFRWDQRLFSLLLKFPGSPHGFDKQAGVIADVANEYLITPMCEITGGKKLFKWLMTETDRVFVKTRTRQQIRNCYRSLKTGCNNVVGAILFLVGQYCF